MKTLNRSERKLKSLKNTISSILFENKQGFISDELMKIKLENLTK